MKQALAFVIVILVIYSAFATYRWYESEKTINGYFVPSLKEYTRYDTLLLSEIDALETIFKNNVSDNVLRERVRYYWLGSSELERYSLLLYYMTGDEKYYTLHVASSNLESFFLTVINRPYDMRKILGRNIGTINSIAAELRKIGKNGFDKTSLAEIENLRNLTEKLSI